MTKVVYKNYYHSDYNMKAICSEFLVDDLDENRQIGFKQRPNTFVDFSITILLNRSR